jgi:hypothetical protein
MSLADIKKRLEASKHDDTTSYCVEKFEPPRESPVFAQFCIKTRAIDLYHHAPTDIAKLIQVVEILQSSLDTINTFDRTRGYPTGHEWMQIIGHIKESKQAVEEILRGNV